MNNIIEKIASMKKTNAELIDACVSASYHLKKVEGREIGLNGYTADKVNRILAMCFKTEEALEATEMDVEKYDAMKTFLAEAALNSINENMLKMLDEMQSVDHDACAKHAKHFCDLLLADD